MSGQKLPVQRVHPRVPRPRSSSAANLVPLLFPLFSPAFACFLSCCVEQPVRRAYRLYPPQWPGSSTTQPKVTEPIAPKQDEDARILDALIRVYNTHQYPRVRTFNAQNLRTPQGHHKPRRKQMSINATQRRPLHTHSHSFRPSFPLTPTREDFLHLVDTYREFYSACAPLNDSTCPPLFLAPMSGFHPSMSPGAAVPLSSATAPGTYIVPSPDVSVSPNSRQEDRQPQVNTEEPLPQTTHGEESQAIKDFRRILGTAGCTHQQAFDAYTRLPAPGISQLAEADIRSFLRCLSVVEKKDRQMSFQYLSVIEEMSSQGLEISDAEKNSAIAFCGQCFSHIRDEHMEKALEFWKGMEQDTNLRSGTVTFNILFDMAAKSGKFVLGEMILKEMEARGLQPNRYSRTSKIYFYGLRKDGEGVRRAYRELVDAGEVVDTVVLNCVIAGLIAAGELASAEHVYSRMKQMLANLAGEPLSMSTWQESRELGRIFDSLARDKRRSGTSPNLHAMKDKITIMPNLHTYAIFIEYHASETGDLRCIAALLDEMKSLDIPLHGRIFLKLFKGFAKHGGQAYSDWTSWRLKKVYQSLLTVLDQEVETVKVRRWLVVWAVRAFAHCAGREWALQVWDELQSQWQPDQQDLELASKRLAGIIEPRKRSDSRIAKITM